MICFLPHFILSRSSDFLYGSNGDRHLGEDGLQLIDKILAGLYLVRIVIIWLNTERNMFFLKIYGE